MFTLQTGHTDRVHDLLLVTALIKDEIETPLIFQGVQADLAELDGWAAREKLEVSRLSLAGLAQSRGDYGLLGCGAVAGTDLGPYIVRGPKASVPEPAQDPQGPTLILNEQSTNFILPLFIYLGNYPKMIKPARESVVEEVARGRAGFGLIPAQDLEEAAKAGLEVAVDLGRWWAERTGLPLVLEVFAVRRALGQETARAVDQGLRRSFVMASTDREGIASLILKDHPELKGAAGGLDPGPYFNQLSGDLGDEGRESVETLLKEALSLGLIEENTLPLWAY